MTPSHTHDVVVVGASVAGCATATFFARAGARVALVERSPDPDAYKVACSHFLLASALPVLDRLGVKEAMLAAGAVPNDIHIHTRWGWLRPPLEHPGARKGLNLRRSVLDPLLRRTAAAEANVELLLGHTLDQLRRSDGRVDGIVARTKDGERVELRAPLVVGADGRGSPTAEQAELPADIKPHGRFNFFVHFRDVELENGTTSQMWLQEPDVAYLFPNDDGVTVACVMPVLERLPEFRDDMQGAFLRTFDGLPEAPDLRAARKISPVMGKIAMPNVARRVADPGVALVGDAAMASDPLWGPGCSFALQSAELLVQAAAPVLDHPRRLDRALRRYRRAHRRRFGGHHFLMADFSTGRPFNALDRLLLHSAVVDGRCADHFAAYGGRTIGVTRTLSPVALARAAWAVSRSKHRGAKAVATDATAERGASERTAEVPSHP
jgi:2-polyprenyl-6-methoxyphenol hydroxylase-like FAD-dependent oxidoreductase